MFKIISSFYSCLNFFMLGAVSTLSRSHSIASAGDKSLVMSSGRSMDIDKNPDRLMHELQIAKK